MADFNLMAATMEQISSNSPTPAVPKNKKEHAKKEKKAKKGGEKKGKKKKGEKKKKAKKEREESTGKNNANDDQGDGAGEVFDGFRDVTNAAAVGPADEYFGGFGSVIAAPVSDPKIQYCGPPSSAAHIKVGCTVASVLAAASTTPIGPSPAEMESMRTGQAELTSAKLRELVPNEEPAEAALIWIQGRESSHRDGRMYQGAVAVAWLIEALEHSGLHESIHSAATQLLATTFFTGNLGAMNQWDVLQNGAEEALGRLASKGRLEYEYDKHNLADQLASDTVDLLWGRENMPPSPHPVTQQHASGDLFTAFATGIEYDDPAKLGEHVAAVGYRILFALLNRRFQVAAESVVTTAAELLPSSESTAGYEGADAKGISRMLVKINKDYAGRASPRASSVNDGLRCLLDGKSPADILSLIAAVDKVFKGHTLQMKNPFALPGEERAMRNHLLLINMTVVFCPDGVTFGSLLLEPESKMLIERMRASAPPGMPADRWFRLFGQALAIISSPALKDKPAAVTAEVQITPSRFKEVRALAHGPYDVIRTNTNKELRDAYVGAGKDCEPDKEATNFPTACFLGQLTNAKRMVATGAVVDINGPGGYDVGGRTPLHCAAQRNHPDIAGWLANEKPGGQTIDLNVREHVSGATPLYMAAQNGFVDVVSILIKAGSEVDKSRTDNGSAPLNAAAQNGHSRVVKLLLEAGAEVDKQKPNTETALVIAANSGHVDVIKLLLDAGADVNHASNFGTPLKLALKHKHAAAAEMIESAGGSRGQETTEETFNECVNQ